MARVSLDNVVKTYGEHTAVDHVNLALKEGELVTLLGPSGCGKTTCLRMIAGFVTPDSGRVYIGDQDVTHVEPYRRETGMVFQQYALFPHMTVAQNLAFGLKLRRLGRRDIDARVQDTLQMVRLTALAQRYPSELSGGQKQRVALARAIIIRPRVLLLDEPLGALDQNLREELQGEIKRIQKSVGITTVFVTHDQGEALALSDRIVVMRAGGIEQIGTPQQIYAEPASRYVAEFIGKANFIDVIIDRLLPHHQAIARHAGSGRQLVVDADETTVVGRRHTLVLRPETLVPGTSDNAQQVTLTGSVFVGDGWQLQVRGELGELMLRTHGSNAPKVGERFSVGWQAGSARLLDAQEHPHELAHMEHA